MSAHLSPEEVSRWILAERAEDVRRHFHECRKCQAEIDRLESALGAFRSSVRAWSNQQFSPQWDMQPIEQRKSPPWKAGLYWAAAAMLFFLAFGRSSIRTVPQPKAAVEETVSDAALLTELDQQISRTVPGPMEPLAELVSWKADPLVSRHHEE